MLVFMKSRWFFGEEWDNALRGYNLRVDTLVDRYSDIFLAFADAPSFHNPFTWIGFFGMYIFGALAYWLNKKGTEEE